MVTVYVDDDLILFAITDSKSSSHGLLADSYYRKLDNMKRRKEVCSIRLR